MKRLFVLLACCAAVALIVTFVPAFAQSGGYLHVINVVRPPVAHATFSSSGCLGGAVTSVPMDCFQFVDSKSSTPRDLLIVGRSPFNRGKTATTVNVMIVPIVLTIGSTVFDPTAVDACFESGTATDLSLFQNSPIFQNVTWDGGAGAGHGAKMNGVNVGTATYNDAVRRAENWAFVGGSNYHTDFNVTTHSAIAINSTSIGGGGITFSSGCGTLGILYLNPAGPGGDWDFYVQNTLIPSLGISATTFPVFLMKNVVLSLSNPPTVANCCVLGYHGAFGTVPGSEWTYSPMDFDTTGDFGPAVSDTSVPSHEVGEWMDDPLGGNPTPAWGNIGQVTGCQGNWEVGDPLSGTNFPVVVMPNGFTYHLQELAFFSWFYNGYNLPSGPSFASIGTGGLFSSNGTFTGASKPCLPGGTYPN
jgi:hypothetical protein